MSNLEPLPKRNSVFRVRVEGLHLRGWAVRCTSFAETSDDIRPGYWLDSFRVEPGGQTAIIQFGPELHMAFDSEKAAKEVVTSLEASIEPHITLEVVKVP